MGQLTSHSSPRARGSRDEGFSLIEVLISMVVMSVGLMALVGVLGIGLQQASGSSSSLIAREKAREAVESVHAARDTGAISWGLIQNTADGGVFLPGPRELRLPGVDGLINTADDADAAMETVRSPGNDGVLGNGDDKITPLSDFTREIQITPLLFDGTNIINPNLRQITVTVKYKINNLVRTYKLTTFVSVFS